MIKNLQYYLSLPYTFIFHLDEDSDVVVHVKELRGCSSHGKTYQEASRNIHEAMKLWIETSLEKILPISEPEVR